MASSSSVGSLGSSPSSLLGSTDSERSSQPEEDVRRDTDYEDKGKEGGDAKLLGNRRRHWKLYKSVNKSLSLGDYHPGDEKPGSVKMSIEDLQKNLSEWKQHHAHLIDQFRKLKSSERKNPSKYKKSIQMSGDMTGTNDPDTDHDDMLRQDVMADKEREIVWLKKQLRLKEEKISQLMSDYQSLEENHDCMKVQLAESRHSVERLEREKMEVVREADRLRKELTEERLARSKEKEALEEDRAQLQRKLQGSLIQLEGEVRMVQQHKADLDSHKLSLAASKEEVEQLRRELTKKRTSVSHLLGTVRSATAQISSLSKNDGRPTKSARKTSHLNKTEYEEAAKELEEELQALCKYWESMRASLVKNTSEIAGLTEAKKKLEEDLHKKIEENWKLEARLKEVREISSRAEANQSRLEIAVANYEAQVQSLRQERDRAKFDGQKTQLENESLRRDLENERQWKEDSDRLHREEVEKLESQLTKEKDSNRTIKANLEEEKRQLDGWLKEERRRVNALESRLSNDSKHKEALQAQLEKKENDTWERQQREESTELIQLRQQVAELIRENQSLNQRNKDLQRQYKTLTDHLNEITDGDRKKLTSLETLIRQVRNERDNLESKNFELSYSSSTFSLNNLDQLPQMSIHREGNIRHFQSSPFHGSSISLNSHLVNSRIETRATPLTLSRQDHLHNSAEFVHHGSHHHHSPGTHPASQEAFSVSSTESEKDSHSQLPVASRRSIELSIDHHLPDNTQSPRPSNSSASTSEND